MAKRPEGLSGQVKINGTDLWDTYGVFLSEDRAGGMDNLKAILSPAGMKAQTGVSLDNEDGRKYSEKLDVRRDEREVTLHFAQYAETASAWLKNFRGFTELLRTGYDADHDGWLKLSFPTIGVEMTVFTVSFPSVTPLTYLWQSGVQAGKYTVKFKEPQPTF